MLSPPSDGPLLERWFAIEARKSTLWTEIRAGIITFFTMAYIMVVNPQILARSSADPGAIPFESLATATAVSSIVACLIVGLVGNLPFGLAPGMGLNGYFTFGVVLRQGLSYQVALTAVFFQGLLFCGLAATGVCSQIQGWTPDSIKKSIAVGLGMFQALIGYDSVRLVVAGESTLLSLGTFDGDLCLAIAGVLLIAILLLFKIKAAMLLGIAFVAVVAWTTGLATAPDQVAAWPSLFGTWWSLDFGGYFAGWRSTFPATAVFLFVAVLDTAGVQMAAGSQAELIDSDGRLPNSKVAFFSSGFSTILGSMLGTSPIIIHIESTTGIQEGGRTGITSLTVAACFLIALPLAPLLKAIPSIASAPPLIIVGVFMMGMVKDINFESMEEALPAFLTLTLTPMTYSIAVGMCFGLAAHLSINASRLAKDYVANKIAQGDGVYQQIKN